MRKLDNSRRNAQQSLGMELRTLADRIELAQARSKSEWPGNVSNVAAEIQSAFIKLRRLRIQVPRQSVAQMASPDFLIDYMRAVGVMLCDDHFREAQRVALDAITDPPDDKQVTLLSTFWDGYDAAAKAVQAPVRKAAQQVRSTNYYVPTPARGVYFSISRSSSQRVMHVYLGMWGSDAKHFFNYLSTRRKELEQAFGGQLEWSIRKEGSLYWILAGTLAITNNEDDWPREHAWLADTMKRLARAVTPALERMAVDMSNAQQSKIE